uniref:Lipase_3 domain-containing protein n=1 Tax=Steinernema glaseri TaxID=37863 RepID=A0A1I7Z143_9BILA
MQQLLFIVSLLAPVTAIALPRPPSSQAALGYSDDLGRNKLMPMSAAAYTDDPSKCVANVFGVAHSEPPQQVSVKCDFAGDTCSAFVTASHRDNAVIVAFRGTEGATQVLQTFDGSNFEHEKFPGGGKVGEYYMQAFRDLWNGGLKDRYLALRNKYPGYRLWVTGHNTGGSLASIFAATVVFQQLEKSENVLLVTFGQLRTGNKDYADAHDRLVTNSFRVVHKRDMIAHLPTLNWEGYYHHGQEIWYDNDMTLSDGDDFTQCKQGESKDCSDGLWFSMSATDNYHYYDRVITKFGANGCQQ